MIVKQYIKDFEQLGFGMFVHFGLYSRLGKGEWARWCLNIPAEEYEPLQKEFAPKPTWAKELAEAARIAGCKYITLTTRHHDGYSLYDTKGLTTFDSMTNFGRDYVREFVDACRENGLIPFFYHTLLDWHHPDYNADFPAYLKYLRASVEILCTNYGRIGGLWFDGMWNKPQENWEEDAMYSMIRSHQPEAMIINNTGLDARGALGHIELDSVTFERGKPQPINLTESPKYIASEMCQVFNDHWGYAAQDLNYKPLGEIIEDLAVCRRFRSNYLLNVGPMGDGSLRPIDRAMLETLGQWTTIHEEALRTPVPTDIAVENKPKDFVLKGENCWYLFVHDLGMSSDPNVAINRPADFTESFAFDPHIAEVRWLDTGDTLPFTQENGRVSISTTPFAYGSNLVVRVAKIITR